MLREFVIDVKGNWDNHLRIMDFAYKIIVTTQVLGIHPFESLYGRRFRYLVGWFEVGDIAYWTPN